MKKIIFGTFWLLLFAVVLFFGKDMKAQPLCGPAQVGVIIYVYEDIEGNKNCPDDNPRVSGLELEFHATDSGGNFYQFYATSDDNGLIQYCFTHPDLQWFMHATTSPPPPHSSCLNDDACHSYFVPNNLTCLYYRWGCENVYCYCDDWFKTGPCTDAIIKDVNQILTHPFKSNLYQNYPNPFNPVTSIKFDLEKESYVKLKVYDLSGKEVITLIDGIYNAGNHSIDFDGSNLSSGLYIYKIETPEYTETKKMILMK